jgi:putative transposase
MAERYPKALVCRVLNVARSSHYHRPKPVPDQELRTAIREVCEEFPCYGYRRVTAELRRRRWTCLITKIIVTLTSRSGSSWRISTCASVCILL